MRDFRAEAYKILTGAVTKSEAVCTADLLWDCAAAVGKAMKDEEQRARNFELMLIRAARRIRNARTTEQLQPLAAQIADLLSRLSSGDVLREAGNLSPT